MLPVNGLYGHIANNIAKSAVLMAGFVLLVAIYWWAGCLLFSALLSMRFGSTSRFGWSRAVTDAMPAHHNSYLPGPTFEGILDYATQTALVHWMIPAGLALVWFVYAFLFYRSIIRAATRSKPLERRAEPKLYNLVENLAISAGLPMPRIELIDSNAMNAYAAGLSPSSATIGVTRGLLLKLPADELEAVLAHEMTHIKNRDVSLMVVALIFANGITLIGNFAGSFFSRDDGGITIPEIAIPTGGGNSEDGEKAAGGVLIAVLAAILAFALMGIAHVFAQLNQFAISRAREYMADAGAVELTKNPDALIAALQRISQDDDVPLADDSMRAMMISRAFDGDSFLDSLFSTHPAIADRVDKLERFAGGRVRAAPVRTAIAARAPAPASITARTPQPAMGISGARATFGRRG